MKKFLLLVMMVVLAFPLGAEGLRWAVGVDTLLSLHVSLDQEMSILLNPTSYLAPSVDLLWEVASGVQIGGEVEGLVGLSAGDAYLGGMLLLRLWWFELAAGPTTIVNQPYAGSGLTYYAASGESAVRMALVIPVAEFGGGSLTLRLSDWIWFTAAHSDLPSAAGMGDFVLLVLPLIMMQAVLDADKVGIGLSYSHPF